VVPRRAPTTSRRDRRHPAVLPPPRRRRAVEPAVRATRPRAVPVPRPVRRRGGAADSGDPPRRVRHCQLPRGSQALRCSQPCSAQFPGARLDAGTRHSGRPRRLGRAARRAR
jgi:hypothetical protein